MGNIDGKDLEITSDTTDNTASLPKEESPLKVSTESSNVPTESPLKVSTESPLKVSTESPKAAESSKVPTESPMKVSTGKKTKTRSSKRRTKIDSTSEEKEPPQSSSNKSSSNKSSSNKSSSNKSSSNKSSSDKSSSNKSSSNKSSSDKSSSNKSSSNKSSSNKSSPKKLSRSSTPTRNRASKSKKKTKLIDSKEELPQEERVDNATQPEVEEKVTGATVVERERIMTAEEKSQSDKKDLVLLMTEKTVQSKKATEMWKKMSEEQKLKILQTVFDKYDTNKDGVISLEELKIVMPNYGINLTSEAAELLFQSFSKPGKTEENIKLLDFSHFCEFLNCFFNMKLLFDRYDVDDDNNITLQQFHELTREYKFQFDEKSAAKLFSFYDTDKDGTMSWSEFSRMMLYLRLYREEFSVIAKERDGIDAADLHALLHSLNIPVSTTEAEIIRKRHLSELDDHGSIESIMVVMLNIESELPELRKEAEAERSKTRDALREHKKIPGRSHMNKKHVPLSEDIPHVKEANEAIQKIKAQLSEGELWSDPQFPPKPETLYKKDTSNLHLIAGWKRPSEIVDDPDVFVEGVDSGDVIQGALGDCWFLSALSTLATHGYADVKKLILGYYPEYGIYQCQFFKNDGWHFVTCDDQLPVDKDGSLVFGSCKDTKEFWVPFLEKAYAKLHGSFEAIEAGSISDGLTDLTGEGSETITIENTPEFWKLLVHHIKEGFLLGCSQTENINKGKPIFGHSETETPLGILIGHAYGIIDCQQVQGHYLLKCRNPWGCKEWKGKWSDGSKEWTPSLQKHFNYTFADDGTFFMCFEDFCTNFNKLYVLRLLMDDIGEHWYKNYHKHEWTALTAGGCPNFATFSKNPQYMIISTVECPVWIHLSQNDSRGIHDNPYEPIGVCLAEKLADNDYCEVTPNIALQTSKYPTCRESSLDFKVVPNKPYVVIPTTFNTGVSQPYYLTVYTKYPLKFEPLTKTLPMTEVKGSWSIKDKTAGGCINQNSWRKNPQYLLDIKKKDTIPILLEQEERKTLEYIAIYAWKSTDGLRLLNEKDPIISGKLKNLVSVTANVELDPGKYIVMPCTHEPRKETNFTVRIVTTDNLTLEPVLEWEHVKATGAWASKTDGGCTNFKTWKNNPCYDLHVPEECQLNILLKLSKSAKEKLTFGFYVFNKSITAVKSQSKFSQSSPPHVLHSVTLPMGDYVILPCTLKPKGHSAFTIHVYSDKPGVTLKAQ